jgi:uncharacterized protein YlaN (UPF0358 family)
MGIRKTAPTKQTQNITAMQTPIQVAKQDKTTPCCPIYIEVTDKNRKTAQYDKRAILGKF